MSESAIRAQIYSILSGVSGIGKVHDYERWSKDWDTFISYFKDTASGRILGWEIGRRSGREEKTVIGIGDEDQDLSHTFVIRGYMAVDDSAATEKLFNALIEAIAAAFREKTTLNGTATDHEYIQRETIEARMFGGVLCHYAELSLTVTERL